MNSIVTVRDASFELPNGRVLFKKLNFSLDHRITALVGPNGIGKTCLAKLIAGETDVTEGNIQRNTSVAFFSQREAAQPISVDQYLADDCTWSLLKNRLLSNIDRRILCTQLSGGQWMRVRLARLLTDRYLILDEPTNDLDREGREIILQFLKDYRQGVLLISHDRECLRLCDEVLELSNKGLAKFGGGWDLYEESKEHERSRLKQALESATHLRDEAALARIEQKDRQEKRNRKGALDGQRGSLPKILLGARKRKAQATTGKVDTATLGRANEAVQVAFEAFNELKVDPMMYADLVGQKIPNQKLAVEASGFNIHFQDWLYPGDLHFSWRGPIRLALKGGNGSGKTTLLKAILGEKFQSRGELRTGNLKTLYVDQKCAQLDDSKSVFENVQDVANLSESEIRNALAKFLFAKETVFQKVQTLSGGERLRAALACGLLCQEKPELLILDEPTNNLDLMNIQFLEKLVHEFQGALLVISHDEIFLENCNVKDEFIFSSVRPAD